jgi:SAM-dependent methyltransferase
MQTLSSAEFKSCCAALYEDKTLQFLLGSSLHPGGLGMTKRLAEKVRLSPADVVLDAACGHGESVRYLRAEYGCRAVGMDLSRGLIHGATLVHPNEGVGLLVGDGECLPIRDNSFTAVFSECSMCLMTRLDVGLSEALRVLRPGGRIGITDIAMGGEIPSDLRDVLARLLCISPSISWTDYRDALQARGFESVEVTDETRSLEELLEIIKKRLFLAEILTAVGKLSITKEKLDQGKRLLSLARDAINQKTLMYGMLTGRKPPN